MNLIPTVFSQTNEAAVTFANQLLFNIVDPIIAILFYVALAYFIFRLAKYMLIGSSDSTGRKAALKSIIFSLVGLFFISSVYTILFFVARISESEVLPSQSNIFSNDIK